MGDREYEERGGKERARRRRRRLTSHLPTTPIHPHAYAHTHTPNSLAAAVAALTQEEALDVLKALPVPGSNRTLGPASAKVLLSVYTHG